MTFLELPDLLHYEVYSKPDCPNCDKAVYLLERQDQSYTKLILGTDFELKDLFARCAELDIGIPRSVPQIFGTGPDGVVHYVGGYSDLERLLKSA